MGSMVTIDFSFFAVHVYDVGGVICVAYEERADGSALQLVLLLVVSRIGVVTDASTFATCIHVRVEVTPPALLGIL